ncbi:prestin-like isoform X4 [Amphibalanus amphitrite]|nr:prestin-like isoform X4 [Amphibalanus amphitrite]XP_043232168.1 prestin-like isoform X4 [Amphibalanus amphitrite]XP_043232169.1 prestin-like isoform X4 [Amphibalanus amphitrite]XP_043232170.1 prestin-like isoform X4 [Amphibalanus amphitrite]
MAANPAALRRKQKMAEAAASCPPVDQQVRVVVARPAFTQQQFQKQFDYTEPKPKTNSELVAEHFRDNCAPNGDCVANTLTRYLPILAWLPAYSIKNDLFGDIIAGVTVAIMHVPQGMAYALLARIPPIHGIYMAFFQCLLYVIFGTSRHVSVGTFAVTCIMTGKVVMEYSEPQPNAPNGTEQVLYDPVLVATTVSMAVGIVELVMFALRIGALTVILSDMLVKGFTTGAAVHVLMSQVKSLFGLTLPRYTGPGKLIKTFVAILRNAFSANPAAMVISGTAISVLVFNNEYLKPKAAKRTKFPIPIELIVVVIGTVASYFGDLHGNYQVQVIGNVTTGLPKPTNPIFSLIPNILMDAVIIAIIAYSVSLSMAQLFAKKHEYVVDANQELIAYGVGNIASSFFACAPMAASLSRSLIMENVGGRTQASGIITSSILLVVLLWLGPLFQVLPNCVLSSIIVVSLKGMFMQFSDLKQVWRTSRADAVIWFTTFAAVVGLDIDIGLAVGVAVSVVVLLLRNQKPETALLGNIDGTDIYLDVKKYKAAEEEDNVKIFQFGGPLHFCNRDYFRQRVIELTGLDPIQYKSFVAKLESQARSAAMKEQLKLKKARRNPQKESSKKTGGGFFKETKLDPSVEKPESAQKRAQKEGIANGGYDNSDEKTGSHESAADAVAQVRQEVKINMMFSHLIFDMTSVGFTDTASTRSLVSLLKEYEAIDVSCYLVGCNETVLRILACCSCPLGEERFFPTVHDTVVSIRARAADPDAQSTSSGMS